jgi:ABC-type multidrug transport system fused ATPase/permease subunit
MKTLKKTLNLLTAEEKKHGSYVLLMIIGMALMEVLTVASIMPFLALIGNPGIIESNAAMASLFTHSKIMGIKTINKFMVFLGIATFLLIIISSIYRTITQYSINNYTEGLRSSLGVRLLKTHLRQPYEYFLDRHSADISKSILSEVDFLIVQVFRPAAQMTAYGLVLIAMTTMLIITNPLLALLTGGILGALYSIIYVLVRAKLAHFGKLRESANKERYIAATEAIGGIKEIKLLGHEQIYVDKFQKHSQQFANTQAGHQTLSQTPTFLVEAVVIGGLLLITVFLLTQHNEISDGSVGNIMPVLGLYGLAAFRMKPAAQIIYSGIASLSYGKASVDNLCSEFSNEERAQKIEHGAIQIRPKQTILFKDLFYTYPNSKQASLYDINFEIKIGSTIGIVGGSGAGKTTLVDIILGLLFPSKGSIEVDGMLLTKDEIKNWQKNLGYVPQTIFLTDSTVAENIALGLPIDEIDMEQVERCARMAQLHDFVMQDMPNRFTTQVGERGMRLSGGQRQRIGIARALYHNPEILVFDEATSALDTLTEKSVMNSIELLSHQKTIVIVAHRLATVRNCDQIILLEQGRIKAVGKFEELYRNDDYFKKIADQNYLI